MTFQKSLVNFLALLLVVVASVGVAEAQVIAYVDVNSNEVLDVGDQVIFQIVDVDSSGGPSVGDTVLFGYFPTSPAATTAIGPTTNSPLTVTAVPECASSFCVVTVGDFELRFGHDSTREFVTFVESTSFVGALVDNNTFEQDDRTWMSSSSGEPFGDLAAVPETSISQPGNQGFFELYFPDPTPVELQGFTVN